MSLGLFQVFNVLVLPDLVEGAADTPAPQPLPRRTSACCTAARSRSRTRPAGARRVERRRARAVWGTPMRSRWVTRSGRQRDERGRSPTVHPRARHGRGAWRLREQRFSWATPPIGLAGCPVESTPKSLPDHPPSDAVAKFGYITQRRQLTGLGARKASSSPPAASNVRSRYGARCDELEEFARLALRKSASCDVHESAI